MSPRILAALAILAGHAACQEGPRREAERPAAGEPAAAAAPATAPAEVSELRTRAHALLAEHCGSCHTRSLPTAVPDALAVYDLDDPSWYAGMSAGQLGGARMRMDGKLEGDDRTAFGAFVDAELALREPGGADGAGKPCRPQ